MRTPRLWYAQRFSALQLGEGAASLEVPLPSLQSPTAFVARAITLLVPPRPALLAFLLDAPGFAPRGLGDEGLVPLPAPLPPLLAPLPVAVVRPLVPVLHGLGSGWRGSQDAGGRGRGRVVRRQREQTRCHCGCCRHYDPTHLNLHGGMPRLAKSQDSLSAVGLNDGLRGAAKAIAGADLLVRRGSEPAS